MSYLDRTADPNRRTTAITGVIVVHALLAYVVVTGLAEHGLRPLWKRGPIVDFPMPTPTPTPPPSPRPHSTPHSDPAPLPDPFPFPTPLPTPTPVPTPGPTSSPGPTPVPSPTPSRAVAFKAKPPVPKNNVASWVTTDDYPARDLREGNEGVSGFRVAVDSNGRVSACEIIRSSGHPGLDTATCKAVTARARFIPATDENGNNASGTYANSVRWQIPR